MKPATPEHLDDPEQPRLTDGGYHWPDEWSAAPAAELRNADVERLRRHIQHHLRHTLAIYQPIATSRHYYLALVHTLRGLGADPEALLRRRRQARLLYQDPHAWTRTAILNVARMGAFSSDRAVAEYARDVWGLGERPAGRGDT